MRPTGVELRRVTLPLVTPFRTSFGTEYEREALLVRVVTPDAEGWGECVAMPAPQYSAEYLDGTVDVLRRFLIPMLADLPPASGPPAVDGLPAADGPPAVDGSPAANGSTAPAGPPRMAAVAVKALFAAVKGHPMAKAALQTALLDAELRSAGMSLAGYLGAARTTVPAGVSVGIMDSVDALLDAVARYLDAGYQRIKLKIEPGWDVEPVRAVRERFGDGVPLQVDANGAYTIADAGHLAKLDPFDLLLIEQPLPEDDLRGHATLARRIRTPICLDEPIISARAAVDAIMLGATSVINIKPGRVGGYLEARRIHDVCAAHGVPVWVGGMVETGIGRAPNITLAALPNCTLVGDVSGSDRFFTRDITPPFVVAGGSIEVPAGPGIGVDPDSGALDAATTGTPEWIRW